MRIGPRSVIAPGLGTCFYSFEEKSDVLMWFLDVQKILDEGIAFKDVASLLETFSGATLFRDATVLQIPLGASCWAPYGMVPIPLSLESEKPAFLGSVPVLSLKLAAAMSTSTSAALKSWIRSSHAKLSADNPEWQVTATEFAAFYQRLEA